MTDAAELLFDPAFGGVECLHARFSTHAFDMHAHEEYVIAIVDAGAEVFSCRGETHVAPAGALYTINPGEPHDGRAAGAGWRYRAIYPSATFVERALGLSTAPAFAQLVWRDAASAHLLSAMHDTIAGPDCGVAKQSAMVTVLKRLFQVNAGVGGDRQGCETRRTAYVRDLLRERYAESHTLESLAREVGLNPSYLLTAFKRSFGVTPAAFLRNERLTHAKALIRQRQPLKAVAQDTGFFDQAHFTRSFKRAFGLTPAVYRAAHAPS